MHTTTCWFAPKAQTNGEGISVIIIHESPEFSFNLEPILGLDTCLEEVFVNLFLVHILHTS